MRFGVLGTGFWARQVHAAAIAEHPTAELVGIWGRDLAKAKAVGAELEVQGYAGRRRAAGPTSTPSQSPCRPTCRCRWPCAPPEAGRHLLLEKPIALRISRLPTGSSPPSRTAGVASVVFFTFRFQPGHLDLAGPGRPHPAGGRGRHLARLPWRGRRSPPRRGSREHGALWDIGPHALSVLVPTLGPVVSVQAGAGLRDTVHLVLRRDSGRRVDGDRSRTPSRRCRRGIDIYVHGDAGRLVLLPEEGARRSSRSPWRSTS